MGNINIGPGLVTSLTILFVLLKAFGKINWAWWIVFAPIWGSALIVLSILIIALICVIIKALIE